MTNKAEPPVLQINLGSPIAAYQQIVDGLRALLVAGSFKPGDRLPTVRQLAVDLGVNHNTVAQAYRLLAEERWVELRRHHGATVIARQTRRPQPARHNEFVQHLRELAARAISDGLDTETVTKQLNALAETLHSKKETP